jgi:DUF2075 family protein
MGKENLDQIEYDLNTTKDGESSEETKCATKKAKLILQAVLDISFQLIVCRGVKVYVEDVQLSVLNFSD